MSTRFSQIIEPLFFCTRLPDPGSHLYQLFIFDLYTTKTEKEMYELIKYGLKNIDILVLLGYFETDTVEERPPIYG